MGLEWSTFNILGSTLEGETSVETFPDGRTIKLKKRDPWVTATVALCTTSIFMAYMDGGKGTISKIFGKSCVTCGKHI